jgi:RNase H-like domain found in reverse transcriptase/Reverse transcriptase (RNA-dependent DNA polymerase)/Integrase zinc binding domain
MFGPPPARLPPLREVNHTIPLINPDAVYSTRTPRCSSALFPLLREKTERYVKSGWWEPAHGRNAIPILCIPKISKELKLRTVIDARERNANTVIDSTPLPSQDMIREAVASHPFVSIIDISDAYEQLRVVPEDVPKTIFASPLGTYVSNTLQQGDCNGPSSWQRFMTYVFRERIGVEVWVYLDDIYIFTKTLEQHENALEYVYNCLYKEQLYISPNKLKPYAIRFNCLGHYRDEHGLTASTDKLELIRNWPTPSSYHDVQRFLGLVEYISRFLPNVSAFTTPLSGMCSNGLPFIWRGIHDKCFETIKAIASQKLSLRPINRASPEPVWVVCDACPSGCGAYYGQGEDWKTMRPAGFMSKKFTNAQRSYFTYEHETLGAIEALKKWDDELLGLNEIRVVTDHEALKTFMQKAHSGPRQIRWSQWLSRYRLKFIHVPGAQNRSADALSRLFENPNNKVRLEDLSTVDLLLDKDGDDLTEQRIAEREMFHMAAVTRTKALKEVEESRRKEAENMVPSQPEEPTPEPDKAPRTDDANLTVASSAAKEPPEPFTWPTRIGDENRPTLEELCRKAYTSNKTFKKILEHPKDHKSFKVNDGLIYYSANSETRKLCIPHSEFRGRRITELVIDQVHRTVGHMGARVTENYARRYFWWPTLGTDVKSFCDSCSTCQATKTSNQRPQGLLHSLPIPTKPWSSIGMDFVGPFPLVNGFDYIWVVLCRLTSLVHLIPLTTTTTAAQLAPLFMNNVVRLHGLPDTIVSDRDPKFTSLFWTETHRLLGVKLAKSTAFHPQTNGASERMIRKVSQVLRTLVRPDQLDWPKHLPTVEFALNSSVCASTGFAPFELTYGYIPRTIQSVGDTTFAGVQDFADDARDMVVRAHDALIASRVEQTHQANQRRRGDDPRLDVGNKAYLSTENLNLPKARARKLMPKYIGPYEIISCKKENSHYTLALPDELLKRRIHPTFHAKLLRPAILNDDARFPNREATFFYDFGDDPEREWLVDSLVDHKFTGNSIQFDVLWETGEITREPLKNCKDLAALDRYLELHGVSRWQDLPRVPTKP